MKEKGFAVVLILLVVFLLIVAGLGAYIWFYRLNKTSTVTENSQKPEIVVGEATKEVDQSFGGLVKSSFKESSFISPTQYIYQKDGDLIIGNFNNSNEVFLYDSTNKFDSASYVQVSPDGKKVTYVKLSSELADKFAKDPPYEFHGSDQFELYMADISNLSSIQTTKIDKVSIYLGNPELLIWGKDSKGFYFLPNSEDIKDGGAKVKYYSIDSKSFKEEQFPIWDSTKLSPDWSQYLRSDNVLVSKTATEPGMEYLAVKTYKYTLDLYKWDGQMTKNLITSQNTEDFIQASPDNRFFINEQYGGEGFLTNKVIIYDHKQKLNLNNDNGKVFRKLEYITTDGKKGELAEDYFENSSDTGFGGYLLSPKAEYLAIKGNAIYLGTNKRQAKVILYDLKSNTKKSIPFNEAISYMAWLDDKRLFVTVQTLNDTNNGYVYSNKIINVENLNEETIAKLNGITVIAIF